MRELHELIDGRTVALVGNATSIFDLKNGKEIDSCDVVIRMNAGFVSSPECQGTRTDAWVSSLALPIEKVVSDFDPAVVVWATSKRKLIPPEYSKQEFKFLKHPLWTWAKLRWRLKARPSTGLIIANYLCKKCKPRHVYVFGFDHFASGTFYNKVQNIGPHQPVGEESCFREFYQSGLFTKKGAMEE